MVVVATLEIDHMGGIAPVSSPSSSAEPGSHSSSIALPQSLVGLQQILASDEKKEKCGVFGVAGPPDAVERCYYGLYALQHRGQESAGIAASDGQNIIAHTGLGLVADVFSKGVLRELHGIAAIGHVRYSTAGSNRKCNAQPLLEEYSEGQVAVAHNGNLINAVRLRAEYQKYGHIFLLHQ